MTKTMTYTNATALAKTIELIADCGDKELLEKLVHMLAQAEKAKGKAKSTGMTKSQRVNAGLAEQLARFMWEKGYDFAEGTAVTSKDLVIAFGNAEVGSTQKAAHLLKLALKEGWVARQEVKGKVLWAKGDVEVA